MFPHLSKVLVERVRVEGGVVRVAARTRDGTALPCPDCGSLSGRVHSRYERHLADLAVGDRSVVIDLTVRRLFCDAAACPRRTFAEQVEELTARYSRYTPMLLGLLRAVGLALAGSAGARLLRVLHIEVSRVTLLALVMALPEPALTCPRVLGIDDFATRRGHRYGTAPVDVEAHRVIDVLPERTAEVVKAWLREHPGAEVICRDRAGSYAEAARDGAPDAVQVADRWHLWNNLGQAVEKAVSRLRASWTPPKPPLEVAVKEFTEPAESALVTRTRERHAAVHALMAKGVNQTGIVRELRLDAKTVRKYMTAPSAEELIGSGPTGRYSILGKHADYLVRRWTEGCTGAHLLHQELLDQGVRVSRRTVRRFVHRLRETGAPPTSGALKAREVSKLVLTHPDNHSEQDALQLKELCARSADLTAVRDLVTGFARVLVDRLGAQELDAWITTAEAGTIAELRSFATGLRRDLDAVHAAVTLEWSSGRVEGQINRLKMLKRQTYGKAGFPLLRIL